MKLFKPQIQLARESEKQTDGSFKDHYHLHSVTFCDRSNYRVSEEDSVIEPLNTEGILNVNLYIYPAPDIVDLNYLTPVVHTVDLGTPIEKGEEFTVYVHVFKELPSRSTNNSAGSSQGSSTQADEDARPGGN